MSFLKVGFWGGVHAAIRLVCGFATAKLIALLAGPSGLAVFGQFQSIASLAYNFSNAGIANGIIRHVAQCDDPTDRSRVVRTAAAITLGCSLAGTALLVAIAPVLSSTLLHSPDYTLAVAALGLLLVFAASSLSLAALLNGAQRSLEYFGTQVVSSVAQLALTALFLPNMGLVGALLAIPLAQVLVFVATARLCARRGLLEGVRHQRWDAGVARSLLAYSRLALVTAIALPGSQLIVREILIVAWTLEDAGHWQAAVRVSEAAFIASTSVLTSYYLPRIAAASSRAALISHVKHFVIIVIPVFVSASALLVLFRGPLFRTLFSPEFEPAEGLLGLQLAGDAVRLGGWIFATVLLARGHTSWIIAAELVSAAFFVSLAAITIPGEGPFGATLSYAGASVVHALLLFLCYRRCIRALVPGHLANKQTS